jgi:hypothetical protein
MSQLFRSPQTPSPTEHPKSHLETNNPPHRWRLPQNDRTVNGPPDDKPELDEATPPLKISDRPRQATPLKNGTYASDHLRENARGVKGRQA